MSSFLRVDPRSGRLGDIDWSSLANTFTQAAPSLLQTVQTAIKPNLPAPIQNALTSLFPPQQRMTLASPPDQPGTLASLMASPAAKVGGALAVGYILFRVLSGGRRR